MRRYAAIVLAAIVGYAVGMTFVLSVCAATLVRWNGAPAHRAQRWADAFSVPTSQERLTIHWRGCQPLEDPWSSCTWAERQDIYMAPTDGRYVFAHEMGHRFDYTVMSAAARRRFGRLLRDSRAWRSGPNALNEQFAEAYALCAVNARPDPWGRMNGGYAYRPSWRVHRRVCALIRGR